MLGKEEVWEEKNKKMTQLFKTLIQCVTSTPWFGGKVIDGPTETSTPHGLDPQVLQLMRDPM